MKVKSVSTNPVLPYRHKNGDENRKVSPFSDHRGKHLSKIVADLFTKNNVFLLLLIFIKPTSFEFVLTGLLKKAHWEM